MPAKRLSLIQILPLILGLFLVFEQASSQALAASKKVEVLVVEACPYCNMLEQFLKDKKVRYSRYDIEASARGKRLYKELGGGGVPIIKIGSRVMRGFNPAEIQAELAGR
ncbi:MAG: hypothetical protein DCC75_08805 [Proteobacteria bacterium]|nr:MAG: hypothetical protein DCC75_08805 [Pseudomonadota bacterium]